jgi:hypothetical protein
VLFLPLVYLFHPSPDQEVILTQWMRYVAKVTPLILESIPDFPPTLIPLIARAINDAEELYTEGADKKRYVITRAQQASVPQTYEVPALSTAIDHIIKMANHASTVSQNLDKGLRGDGSPKA